MINVGNTRWRLGRTMIALFVVSLSLLLIGQNVYADVDSNPEIVNKAIATSLLECYSSADVFKTPLTVGEFNEGSGVKKFMNKNDISAGAPNGYLSGDPSTCDGFMGKLLEKKQLSIPNSDGNVDSFLKTIGYTSTSPDGVSGDCFYYSFRYKENGQDGGVRKTHSICPVVDSSGKITKIEFGKDNQDKNSGVIFSGEEGTSKLMIDYASLSPQVTIDAEGLTYSEFKEKVMNEVSQKVNMDLPLLSADASGSWTFIETPKDVPRKEVDTEYTKDDTSVGTAMQALIGEKFDETPTFSDEETFVLYQSYLVDYYNSKIRCDLSEDEVSSLGGSYKETKYYDGEEIKTCYVVETNNSGNKVHSIESGKFSLEANCDFDCVTSWLKNSSVTKDGLKDFNLSMGDDQGNTVTDPLNDGEEDECISSKGAGSLGWIVCPLLKWMSDAATQTYEDYVAPSLQIEPTLFNGSGGDNVKTAWGTFRDIANVLFIILFLVVIFSQLTGIGIDNYGIKKILPRLIVAAIMINLSYIICILLVDLSNILGNGLKGIFDALGAQLNPVVDFTADGAESSGGAVSGVLASVGVLAAVGVMGGVIWANPAILLSLLVGALGVIVAIFFLFILLAARKAAVIVLTVISPLAVVAYMLPNTKKLFDKWWRFFEGLLLIYPIAGLLVGGGDYISRLLLGTSTGFLTGLTAMVVGIVPIFFIPTVLKDAFAAMGKVGGTLAGMGSMARGRVTGATRNSEAYRNAQRMGLERRTRVKAGLDRNGNLTRGAERKLKALNKLRGVPIVGGVASGMTKGQAAKIAQAKKDLGASESAVATTSGLLARTGISSAKALPGSGSGGELGSSFDAGTEGAYYGGMFLDAASSKDISGMNAAIEAMRSSRMKPKDIAKVVRFAQNNGYFNGMDKNDRSAWFKDLSSKYDNDFLSTDFELNHFMMTGGSGNGGTLGDYGNYAEHAPINTDEIKPEDLIKLSGDSLAGMAASGKLTQSMAQRVVAMNPNISEDKKIMFGALASGAATASTITAGNTISYKDAVNNFKKDAEMLMTQHTATAGTPGFNNTIQGTDAAMVEAWASSAPMNVNVVQNFKGGGQQYDDVYVASRGSGGSVLTGGSTTGPSSAGPTPTPTLTPTLTPTPTPTPTPAPSKVHEFNFRNMGNDAVLDAATAPGNAMNDPVRQAAEREVNRRVQDGKMKL